jgi:hypothetical protein
MSTVLVRVPVGVLADGTPYFAPLGEVIAARWAAEADR